MAGTVIPAALLTAVNSDLPGQVIATVTEQVYDSVTGRHLLIPQGSRLIGQYDSQVPFGQRRALLVWTRLIRPNGSSLVLDRLPATDAAGQMSSEEHTSELQSLMRISYAVFCLTNKTKTYNSQHTLLINTT